MADKGFEIEDLLLPLGAQLNAPPFLDKRQQMLPDDIRSTKSIASVRIHVERAIGRLKVSIFSKVPSITHFLTSLIELSLLQRCYATSCPTCLMKSTVIRFVITFVCVPGSQTGKMYFLSFLSTFELLKLPSS